MTKFIEAGLESESESELESDIELELNLTLNNCSFVLNHGSLTKFEWVEKLVVILPTPNKSKT